MVSLAGDGLVKVTESGLKFLSRIFKIRRQDVGSLNSRYQILLSCLGVYTPRHVCIGVWGVWRFTLFTGTFSSEINHLTSYSDYEPLSSRTGREFSTTNTTGTIVPSSSRLEEIYSSLVVLVHHMSFHSPPAYHHLCDVNMCIIDIWVYCCDISWFVVSRMIDYLQISSSISSRRRFSSWDLSAGKAAEGFHFHFQICRDALPQISLNNLIATS